MRYYSASKKVVGAVMLALLLIGSLVVVFLASPEEVRSASPGSGGLHADAGGGALLSTSELTHHVYLPAIFRQYGPRSFRLGYCSVSGSITEYPAIRELAAGWYVNFNVRSDPVRPLGMEYVQTVRLHQLTECWDRKVRDREVCPYVKPYTYTLTSPSTKAALRSSVAANPGALWLIGNEMDRYDWGGRNPWNPEMVSPIDPTQGQDEMLPELYAVAYHELYHLIKGVDPTARVAIGGIIQATPARLWYLDTVWDTYREKYGDDMPVDVWNVHNFIFKEKCDDYGADIPPGCPASVCKPNDDGVPCYGKIYGDKKHNDLEIFDDQIRAFRKWMKDHGQQEKPLIVSEYGITLYSGGMEDSPDVVKDFMLDTFDYFMTTRDCELGYHADDCRLVQRWAWYSLDDASVNKYAYLFNPENRQMTALGRAFVSYAQDYLDVRGTEVPGYWP